MPLGNRQFREAHVHDRRCRPRLPGRQSDLVGEFRPESPSTQKAITGTLEQRIHSLNPVVIHRDTLSGPQLVPEQPAEFCPPSFRQWTEISFFQPVALPPDNRSSTLERVDAMVLRAGQGFRLWNGLAPA